MKIKVYNMDMKIDPITAGVPHVAVGHPVIPAFEMLADQQDGNGNPVGHEHKYNKEYMNYRVNYMNNRKSCESYSANSCNHYDDELTLGMFYAVSKGIPELYNWYTPVEGAYTPSLTESVVIDLTDNKKITNPGVDLDGVNSPRASYTYQTSVDMTGMVKVATEAECTTRPWYLLWWYRSVDYCVSLTYKLANLFSIVCWYGQLAKKKKLHAQVRY